MDLIARVQVTGDGRIIAIFRWCSSVKCLVLSHRLANLDHCIGRWVVAVLKFCVVAVRVLIEYIVRDLLHLVAGLNFFEDRIGDHFLFDKFGQLKRRHLQHLYALPQLRR